MLSLVVVVGLIVFKIVVAALTGSISILAQAADSFLDLFAVVITFFAVIVASRPADMRHPFGHGKVENIAAVVQAMLIFTAGGLIIYSAIDRIRTGATIQLTEAGMGVMVVSIVASILLSRHLLKVARADESVAVEANARNIAADVYSATAVLAGLIVIRFTGLTIIDPIMALLVALYILKVAYDVLKKSFGELIDVKLSENEEDVIRASITVRTGEVVNFHKLRTRKAGSERHIDLHLVVPRNSSVAEAHQLCDELERDICEKLRQANVVIHIEPCHAECEQCPVSCDSRQDGS